MSLYLTIPGCNALSDFREEQLRIATGAQAIRAVWVHYVQPQEEPSLQTQQALERLLQYGQPFDKEDQYARGLLGIVQRKPMFDGRSQVFFVLPRPGWVSPWSSQATSFTHGTSLGKQVKRIERGMAIMVTKSQQWDDVKQLPLANLFHDRMTQMIVGPGYPDLSDMFRDRDATPQRRIDLHGSERAPRKVLEEVINTLGMALDSSTMDRLERVYEELARNPTDVELFMFAQVNSEHCRHTQFNTQWTIDGIRKADTLMEMIKDTHRRSPKHTVSAYSDNAAVCEGPMASVFDPSLATGEWTPRKEVVHYLVKVETHNHPTAVSPYQGAATGSGGEIRDEGAVGRGSKPKAGLTGFNVSDLLIPGHRRPWELDVGKPHHIASSLDIILEAPIGSATYNNEFGRPCTTGYFRTLLTRVAMDDGSEELRGYHKPIMIAGGVGTVRPQNALKDARLVRPGAHVVVLGGPAILVGLGGGATSSMASGEASADLDFASVQRENPEMERRAQMVIDACAALGDHNPIALIHDVGAGGLSNAIPELLKDAKLGAELELREIECVDRGMSPLEIWCCEAQERYVMIVNKEHLATFQRIAKRERCGYSVLGQTKADPKGNHQLVLKDREFKDDPNPVDLPMSDLFDKSSQMIRTDLSRKAKLPPFDAGLTTYLPEMPTDGLLKEAVDRVLTLPAVGSKSFLITIGDRSVGGLVVRDQMVGRWQVPVADVSVTATSLMPGITTGEAMAMGERPTLAFISPAASARMAVVEALTNLGAADLLGRLNRVRLSANWMAATSHPGEAAALYEAVHAVAMDLCPELGLSIPVGKDSLSMKMKWQDPESQEPTEVTAPLSLVISAFAPVKRIANTWTPALRRLEDVGEETTLFLVDLAKGMRTLGGSALAQVFGQVGNDAPDVRDVQLIKDYFDAVEQLHEAGIVLAYHDRSDGGLFTTLVEMMFAGRCGLDIGLDDLSPSSQTRHIIEALFNEELGGVFQVRKSDETNFKRCFATCGPPPGLIKKLGSVPAKSKQRLFLQHNGKTIFTETRGSLQQRWASTSHALRQLRDNPECADAEHATILDDSDRGLSYHLTFRPNENILPWKTTISAALVRKPRVAILREQGVNGHAEMAFAFHQAGFSAIDVHMTDILGGRVSLSSFSGLAVCGGFSYGDVLGAGRSWANSVLLNDDAKQEFRHFFERKDTFTLGVCNGAQVLTQLQDLIPGTQGWPLFERNISAQYEARLCMVEVVDPPSSTLPSVFLHGMHGSKFPVVVAHAEGRAVFPSSSSAPSSAPSSSTSPPSRPSSSQSSSSAPAPTSTSTAIRFVSNNTLKPTEQYPFNPNGSKGGVTGVRSSDGRVLAMMPHPERMILKDAVSWAPNEQKERWGGDLGPWSRLFLSARRWVG